jgi:hypothetical protein
VGEHAVVVVRRHGGETSVEIVGALVLDVPAIETAAQWCEYYGVEVEDGIATLYKALDDEYRSNQTGFQYLPGSTPAAPDWDGGEAECGGGLHFAPHPALALQWFPAATRFVACPVELDELVVHEGALYPQKVKAPRVCGPVFEVAADSNPLESAAIPQTRT